MIVALAVAGVASSAFANDMVLFWMLDDPDISSDYGPIKASEMGDWGHTIDSARVVATREGYDTVYLDLYYQDGSAWVVDPTADPRIDTAGVTKGTIDGGYARASLGTTLGANYALYSFAIELGTWNASDEWVLAAVSDTQAYAQLQDYVSHQVDIPTATRWTGTGFTAVPEPSSALLILLGGSLLALRRKRRVVA